MSVTTIDVSLLVPSLKITHAFLAHSLALCQIAHFIFLPILIPLGMHLGCVFLCGMICGKGR